MKIQDRIKMKTKSNKGITLIALVITIIVLLILAGVTIAALSGDNGILKRATEAKEQTNQKNDEETEKLAGYESTIDQYANGATGGSGNGGSGSSGTGTNFTNVNAADSNPAGVVPENSTVVEADASKGIVIKDKNNNEWVWIEVPKTTVFTGLTIDTTGTLTEQNYTDIKNKRNKYGEKYRECEVCAEKVKGKNTVFITDQGNRFHYDLNCGGIKRTIYMIRLSFCKKDVLYSTTYQAQVGKISKSFLIYTYLTIEDILQVPMDMYLLRLVSISLRKEY